ncbi:hypothetical protein [Pseudonocardia sp.]|uniref:hypothetical protein n=1 Tax=Pseudonocardia sp. TaxID=60912 RepID=UPI002634B76F|nr:hypothetical protein [Pseudonocardia sp.]
MTREPRNRTRDLTHRLAWAIRLRLEPLDERGGGRNSDEGMHIGAGAVIAGTIAAGIGAFVASKLGALK